MRLRAPVLQGLGKRFLVETGIGANLVGRGKIGNDEIDGTVALRLNDQLAVELQRRAEQHGQHHGLGDEPGDRKRIVVALEDRIEHRAELNRAAAHIEAFHLEGHDMIVTGKIEFAKSGRHLSHLLLLT